MMINSLYNHFIQYTTNVGQIVQPFNSGTPSSQTDENREWLRKSILRGRRYRAGSGLQGINKTRGSESVQKAGLSVDNSLRSNNSTESPKGRIQNLKFY